MGQNRRSSGNRSAIIGEPTSGAMAASDHWALRIQADGCDRLCAIAYQPTGSLNRAARLNSDRVGTKFRSSAAP